MNSFLSGVVKKKLVHFLAQAAVFLIVLEPENDREGCLYIYIYIYIYI